MTFRGILTLATGLAIGLAARSDCAAQTAGPPLQPRFDSTGKFAHAPDVAISVVSISPSEVVVECSQGETATHAATVWRERYAVRDGKIFLAAISTQREIPAQAEHDEWQETTISQTPTPPAADTAHSVSPPGTESLGVGATGVDPRWNNYNKYLARLIATIQSEWDRSRIAGKLYPRSGSRVAVTFLLTSRGDVARVLNVDSSPALPDEVIRACIAAVTARAPYGEWPDEMTAALGASQRLTFTFYYP